MSDLIRAEEVLDKGVDIFGSDFGAKLHLQETSYNLTMGLKFGLGPRFGISPIPGHNHTEDTTTTPVGLQQSEGTGGADANRLRSRLGLLGVATLSLGTYDDIKIFKNHYFWIITKTVSGTHYLDVCYGCKTSEEHQADIAAKLAPRNIDKTWDAGIVNPVTYYLYRSLNSADGAAKGKEYLTLKSLEKYVSFSEMVVSGRPVPMHWMFGDKKTTPDATHTGDVAFNTRRQFTGGGCPPLYNQNNPVLSQRTFTFYNLNVSGSLVDLEATYFYDSPTLLPSYFVAQPDQSNDASLVFSALTATNREDRLDSVAPDYAAVDYVLVHDPDNYCPSGYQLILIAAKKPICFMVQEWQRDSNKSPLMFYDLTESALYPPDNRTLDEATNNPYTETTSGGAIEKRTCWYRWPLFDEATPLTASATSSFTTGNVMVRLGAAGSGILRANTIYEFTYSVYDKLTSTETNVGAPAKVLTGADDFVAITIHRDPQNGGGDWLQIAPVTASLNTCASVLRQQRLGGNWNNYQEIRIYYRVMGSHEWLPALFIDSAKFNFYPDHAELWACQGAIAASTGGQPGGFNDYSSLPKDEYDCVVVFRERAFWLSRKQAVYSGRKQPLVYASRISVAAPSGSFRGALVHAYPGQAEQDSRIVIFGSEGTYIGRFTGNFEMSPVTVGNETYQYPLEGSDFQLDTWTDITAFSYRSAVVAEGLLYYWGSEGIFIDTGAQVPVEISKLLEPEIDTYFDPNKTDEIFAHYFSDTKEIVWFYPPKSANTLTYGISYSLRTNEFNLLRWAFKIDSIQSLKVEDTDTSRDIGGIRTVISSREDNTKSIQRAYFFDSRNRSGDMWPTTEWLVKTIASPTSDTRRLTLATGFDATNFGTIAAADKLVIQQGADYSDDDDVLDLIGSITATNAGNGTIDFSLPTTAAAFKGALSITDTTEYFPIWIDRHNKFAYILETNYWCPNGPKFWGYWHYIHTLFNVSLLYRDDNPTLVLQYRTPIADSYVSKTVSLADNSDGNCQIFSSLESSKQSIEGQGLKLKISGDHIGHKWMLQYLGVDYVPAPGRNLLHFEG